MLFASISIQRAIPCQARVQENTPLKIVIYRFRDFQLDSSRRTLSRNGQIIHMAPQVFRILLLFVRNSGALISREDINVALGRQQPATRAMVDHYIQAIRSLIDDPTNEVSGIGTVHGRGFRFMADVCKVIAIHEVFEPCANGLGSCGILGPQDEEFESNSNPT